LRGKLSIVCERVTATAAQYFRSRGVEVRGAPFEADFDCAYLQRARDDVAAVYSEDSDLYALGATTLIMGLNRQDGKCDIVERGKNEKHAGLRSWAPDKVIAYCCFMGNDFIPRVQGNAEGPSTRLAELWCAAKSQPAKDKVLRTMNGKHIHHGVQPQGKI
jgi:5'-3' exonuclease